MKTISITEPYASLILNGEKHIETRSWKTNYRGEILIHASATKVTLNSAMKKWGLTRDEYWKLLERAKYVHHGFIIAKAKLVDCVKMTSEWIDTLSESERTAGFYSEGRYGWILEDVTPVEFTKAKGKLGLWEGKL